MDWGALALIAAPIVGGVVGFVYVEDWKLPRLRLPKPKRKPKAIQEKAAFEELYRWKTERRRTERAEWMASYTMLLANLPGQTTKRVQTGLRTERVTIKAASGEIVAQYEQEISEWLPYYFKPRQDPHVNSLTNRLLLDRIRRGL